MGIVHPFSKSDIEKDKKIKKLNMELELKEFEENMKLLYQHGKSNILSKVEDRNIILHSHVMLNYIPKQVHCTWEYFQLKLGAYSIQGC